jgi:hypothetical protein
MVGMPLWRDAVGLYANDTLTGEYIRLVHAQPDMQSGWQSTVVQPTLTAFVAYFAFLFVLLRWWRQAEYTRHRRLSIWSIGTCVLCAWFLHLVWWFPQPTGMMIAAVIATSTQMASPWLPPSQRRYSEVA